MTSVSKQLLVALKVLFKRFESVFAVRVVFSNNQTLKLLYLGEH